MTAGLVSTSTSSSTSVATPSTYRPHLDGLRTVAVYLVVLFHAGIGSAAGGFIGVDVFFVLSGYLVTQMLLRDLARPGGLRYGRFYARRVRRLLPAGVAMLVVTAIVYRAVAGPGDAVAARPAFQASFLYVANWFFVHRSTGYFGADIASNPVLHVWSLAVEEQFYLVWPLLLGGAFWLARRARVRRPVAWVRILVVIGAIASLTWALVAQSSRPEWAYYGTDTRAYQLLGGATLALTTGAIRRRARTTSTSVPRIAIVALMGALLVLATSLVTVGPIVRGACATAVTVGILALLEGQPGGLVQRFLSSGPMVYLGQISYGTYLWHWPVIVVTGIIVDPTPASLTAITLVVGTALAALSYQLLEMPIRHSVRLDRHRFPVIAIAVLVGLVGAFVVVPAVVTDPPTKEATAASTARFTPLPANLDLERVAKDRFGKPVNCLGRAPAACTIVRGKGPKLLLMGDSNATMLIPALTSMARDRDLTLSVSNADGCVWQRGINYLAALSPQCDEIREDTYRRVIPALRPDIIVLANVEPPNGIDSIPNFREAAFDSLGQLKGAAPAIVLVKPLVDPPSDQVPLDCLARASYVEDCRFVANTRPGPTARLYDRLVIGRPDVKILNLDRLACPYLPICDPIIGGNVVRWDGLHLAFRYSASLGRDLGVAFQNLGVLSK